MKWSAQLSGHQFDLNGFTELFEVGDPKVVPHDDGRLHLEGADLDRAREPREVLEIAGRLLSRMNGFVRLRYPSHGNVSLSGLIKQGTNLCHVFAEDDGMGRDQVHVATGGAAITPAPTRHTFERTARHPAMAEVLDLLGKPDGLSLVNLYKVYEIIRHDLGGGEALANSGLTSKAAMSAFTATANRPDISGDDARHARLAPRQPMPTNAMTQDAARSYVLDLVGRWADEKNFGASI